MLGSNNNQNGNQKYEPTYYSRLNWKNDTDRLRLSPNFWKGSLKLAVQEVKTDGTRAEDLAYIHLSPIKAMTMANYVKKHIDEPELEKILGVNTGASDTQGLLAIGKDEGKPYIIVAKIDRDGNFVQSQRFNFNHNYHYGLQIEDMEHLTFSKEYSNGVELQQFYDLLMDYAHSANGAMAASVWDVSRYDALKTINQIADKIGAKPTRGNGGGNNGNAGDSFFANNGNDSGNGGFSGSNKPSGGYSSGSIDDLEEEFN